MQRVLMMPLLGTTATVLTTLVAPGDFLGTTQPISVDATGVYVPANPGAGVDAVLSVPLAGGAAATVASFASAFNGVPGHRIRRKERLLGESRRTPPTFTGPPRAGR